MLSEADRRSSLIDAKLHKCGWSEENIEGGRFITPGRLIDENGKRKKGMEIDYILYHNSIPIAIVEAKTESKSVLSGMEHSRDDAKNFMHLFFAYSTKGHQIEEFDFTTNKQKSLVKSLLHIDSDCLP